jgi:poly-gamma-glutamate capsule biosynthesis protein CapA/YwtB (metallophosphatase superfamily)
MKLNPSLTHVTPDTLEGLREMGFNLLALANTHAWDLGGFGLGSTIEESRRAGFVVARTGHNRAGAFVDHGNPAPHGIEIYRDRPMLSHWAVVA